MRHVLSKLVELISHFPFSFFPSYTQSFNILSKYAPTHEKKHTKRFNVNVNVLHHQALSSPQESACSLWVAIANKDGSVSAECDPRTRSYRPNCLQATKGPPPSLSISYYFLSTYTDWNKNVPRWLLTLNQAWPGIESVCGLFHTHFTFHTCLKNLYISNSITLTV